MSKPVSLEPSKSASPSPPPPLIPEVEPVELSLVPMEPPVDADTKVELGEAPPDPHKTLSAITTVPGPVELPAPDMDTVAVEEEVAIPLPEPAPQAPVPSEVPLVPVVPLMPAVPLVPAAPSPPPVVPQAPEAPAKPASPSPPLPREEPCPEPTTEANGVLDEALEPVPEVPVCQPVPVPAPVPVPVPTLDSPIAQPEELSLPNGVEGTGKAEPSEEQPELDISPISEPEEPALPGTPASPPVEEEEEESEGPSESQERSSSPAPAPSQTLEATSQGWVCWAGACEAVGCPTVGVR